MEKLDRAPLFMTGEHWRQWIATLGPMLVTAIGVAFWVVAAISTARDEASTQNQAVLQRVLTDEGRLAQLESAVNDLKTTTSAARGENNTAFSNLLSSISDLRVQLARQQDGKSR